VILVLVIFVIKVPASEISLIVYVGLVDSFAQDDTS